MLVMLKPTLLLAAAAALLAAPAAAAPAPQAAGSQWRVHFWLHDGHTAGEEFGWAVSAAGDLDADGRDDFLVSAVLGRLTGGGSPGSVFAYSSRTGAALLRLDGGSLWEEFGYSLAAPGDLDGDGHDDILVGTPFYPDPVSGLDAGAVSAHSGRDGSLLYRILNPVWGRRFGQSVASVGDADGDGTADFLVGAPRGLYPYARVYSGRTGVILWEFQPPMPDISFFGNAVSGVGDADGDSVADLAVGAPWTLLSSAYEGSVYVYSGATGALLHRLDGSPWQFLGSALAPAGDMDGDGLGDLVVSALGYGSFAPPLVRAYSGATGAILLEIAPPVAFDDLFGVSVGGADVDGDGIPDLVVGAPGTDGPFGEEGAAIVYSGAGGGELHRLQGAAKEARLGLGVAVAGDANRDGHADVIAGETGVWGTTYQNAYVFGLRPFLGPRQASLSQAAGGLVLFELHFADTAAWHRYQILASASGTGPTILQGLEVPLTPDALFWRTVGGSYPPYAWGFGGALDAHGDGTAALAPGPGELPAAAVGRTIYLAALEAPLSGPPQTASNPALFSIEP